MFISMNFLHNTVRGPNVFTEYFDQFRRAASQRFPVGGNFFFWVVQYVLCH